MWYLLYVHKVNFCYRFVTCWHLDLFWLYFRDCFHKDDCLHYVSKPQHLAIGYLYKHSNNDCV